MAANRILNLICGVLGFVVIPAQIVTTLLLGIVVRLSFGLFLLPISLGWSLLFFPLLGLSRLCRRFPALRNAVGFLFIPWVIVADTFVSLMPSMGELENRAAKMMLCDAWPFTWEFHQFLSHRLDLGSEPLDEVVARISRGDALRQRVVMHVTVGEQLDPGV